MLFLITVLCVILWIVIDDWRRRKIGNAISKLPISKTRSFPFIGQAYKFIGNNEDIMSSLQEVGAEANGSGGVLRFWFGRDPFLVPIWRPRRKMLGRALNSKVLRNFMPVFARQSAAAAARLRRACGTQPVALWNYLTTFTLDSVCETNLGVSLAAARGPERHILRVFEGAFSLLGARLCQPWLQHEAVYHWLPQHATMEAYKRTLYAFIDNIIAEKKKEKVSENNKVPSADKMKTFMEILLEAPEGFSDRAVREECLVMALAGTDTSAIGACSTLLMMGRHPDVQEKAYREIREVIPRDAAITTEHLSKLRYLDAVIKETLRLYPPVPTIGRKIDCPTTIYVTLSPGISVLVNIWGLHRNPAYWGSDAEQFRPERFLDGPPPHPAAYAPFSYGPRNCIGSTYAMLSMKTVLSTLMLNYRFLPSGEDSEMRLKYEVTMKDVDNYMIRLEPRGI